MSHQLFFPQTLPLLHHVNLLSHLTVPLLSTIPIHFWLFFSLLFHTLTLYFLQPFHSLFYFSSPIFFFISFYCYSCSNFSPPFLAFLLFHYSTSYYYNSSNPSSPFFTLLLPIFFFRELVLLSLHLPLPLNPCSAYKK